MKNIFKRVLAVTAFVAAGTANAQTFIGIPNPYNVLATQTLVFSNDGLSALASAGISVTTPAVIPSIAGVPDAGATNAAVYSTSPTKQLTVNNSSVAHSGDGVTSLSSPDAFVRLSRGVLDANDNLLGTYRVYLSGWEMNLALGSISANLYTSDLAGNLTSYGKTVVFQADQAGVVGGTGGAFVFGANGATASGTLAGGLRLTTQSADIILSGLGVDVSSPNGAFNGLWRQSSWGTASFTAPAVPEPSTYLLFGAGLLGMGLMGRRRQQAQA